MSTASRPWRAGTVTRSHGSPPTAAAVSCAVTRSALAAWIPLAAWFAVAA
ncbi:hypothetical protein NKH18_18270 [Streptomyces sp. M10(2022)]